MDALNEAQRRVVDRGLLRGPFSVVLQLATGAGKTWLAREAVRRVVAQGGRALYVSPLKALASEVVAQWRGALGVPIALVTGRVRDVPGRLADAAVVVMTPERLDLCTRRPRVFQGLLARFEVVVVDEIHLLGDAERGPRLEGALLRLLRLNPLCRVLGLTATVGNPDEIAGWLDGVWWRDAWRPVPLAWRIERFEHPEEKLGLTLAEVRGGGRTLVFVHSRRRAEGVAAWLAERGVRAAAHHAAIARREAVEAAFRAGEYDALVATSTLEMGLNLPCRRVVLFDVSTFDGVRFRPLPVSRAWQRAGRAGRPGLDAAGEVVVLAPTWDRAADRLPLGQFEAIRSGLARPDPLAEQILAEVGSGLCRSVAHLERWQARTLAARHGVVPPVRGVVDDLVAGGLLTGDDELRLTRTGWVAVRSLVGPAACAALARWVGRGDLTVLDWLVVTAPADRRALDPDLLPELAMDLAAQPSRLIRGSHAQVVEAIGRAGRDLLGALSAAGTVLTWMATGDAEATAARWSLYPTEVRHRVDEHARQLQTALRLRSDHPSLATVHTRVRHGLDAGAASMLAVRGLGGSAARRLRAAGLADIEDLALADVAATAAATGLSARRLGGWIDAARDMPSAWDTDDGPGAEVVGRGLSADPYRLRRALDLDVAPIRDGWRVSGGLEAHRLSADLGCDCGDAARGHTCKHALAVRLHLGDVDLDADLAALRAGAGPLDLMALWGTA